MVYLLLAVKKLEPARTENMVSNPPVSDTHLGLHQGTPQKQSWPGMPLEASWGSRFWAGKDRP